MKWLYVLLTIATPYFSYPPTANAEFDRSAPRVIRATSINHNPTAASVLVDLSQTAIYELIDRHTLDITVTYYVDNRSDQTVNAISMLDSLGTDLNGATFSVTTAPNKVSGPATVTANSSWTGFDGGLDLLSGGANSLAAHQATTISYKVRITVEDETFQGTGFFGLGVHLGGTQGAGEINGSTELTFGIPLSTCVNDPIAFQEVHVISGNGTYSIVEFEMWMLNPAQPGCIGVEPTCTDATGGASDGDAICGSFESAIWDSLEDGLGTSTWEWGNELMSGPDESEIVTSVDANEDGLFPSCTFNPEWELNPHVLPLAQSVTNLGAGEWLHFPMTIKITHAGTTSWTNRLWAKCWCPTCPTQCDATSHDVSFAAFPTPTVASRMTLGNVGGVSGSYTLPCSTFVYNAGGTILEKHNVKAPITSAFPATSTLTSVSDPTSTMFPGSINASFDGVLNDTLLISNVANDMPVGETDTLTFVATFNQGNQTSWNFKAKVHAQGNGGGAGVVDSTNCGPNYDTDGDLVYNEENDNAACVWTITPTSAGLLQPGDFEYLGAFRLPGTGDYMDYSTGPGFWHAAGVGGTNFPGTLFITGSDGSEALNRTTEVSIPETLGGLSVTTIGGLPQATIVSGSTDTNQFTGGVLKDIELLEVSPGVYRAYSSIYDNNEPSGAPRRATHIAFPIPLSAGTAEGKWYVGQESQVQWLCTRQYNCTIDSDFVSRHSSMTNKRLGCGRHREGQGHFGPSLVAFDPWDSGAAPATETVLSAKPLILYGIEADGYDHWVESHCEEDNWTGVTWVNGNKSAVLIFGSKGRGCCWYGWRNGCWPNLQARVMHQCSVLENPQNQVECGSPGDGIPCQDCSSDPACDDAASPKCNSVAGCDQEGENTAGCGGGNRGYIADYYTPRILFYSVDDLDMVADNLMESWEIQPYVTYDIGAYMMEKRSGKNQYYPKPTGCLAYDSVRRYLYVSEFYHSAGVAVHVFHLGG
jgi:hypothetical protein